MGPHWSPGIYKECQESGEEECHVIYVSGKGEGSRRMSQFQIESTNSDVEQINFF